METFTKEELLNMKYHMEYDMENLDGGGWEYLEHMKKEDSESALKKINTLLESNK